MVQCCAHQALLRVVAMHKKRDGSLPSRWSPMSFSRFPFPSPEFDRPHFMYRLDTKCRGRHCSEKSCSPCSRCCLVFRAAPVLATALDDLNIKLLGVMAPPPDQGRKALAPSRDPGAKQLGLSF